MRVIDTLGDFFFYLEHTRKIKPSTMEGYASTMKRFCDQYGMKETVDLSPTHIFRFEKFLETKRTALRGGADGISFIKPSYIRVVMIRIRAYVARLGGESLLRSLKANDIKVKRQILENPSYFTQDEIRAIFQTVEEEKSRIVGKINESKEYDFMMGRAMLYLYYYSGLRNTAVRNISLANLDLKNMRGTVMEKYDRNASFTFAPRARDAILDFLAYRDKFFSRECAAVLFADKRMHFNIERSKSGINRPTMFLKKICELAGIKKGVHIHMLRHSCATHLLDAGANIREVQEKLGHRNLDTTMLYTHITNKRLSEITASMLV